MVYDRPRFGFDAQAEECGDMLKAGVIDPTKVLRIAPENAASIAGLLIATEAMVGKAGASSEMSDMGGMMWMYAAHPHGSRDEKSHS